jgi:hypothetical protein
LLPVLMPLTPAATLLARCGFARFCPACSHTGGMPVRLHHIVIGTDDDAPVGICFMPVTEPKAVKNRVHVDLTSSAQDREQEIERLVALGRCPALLGRLVAGQLRELSGYRQPPACAGPHRQTH